MNIYWQKMNMVWQRSNICLDYILIDFALKDWIWDIVQKFYFRCKRKEEEGESGGRGKRDRESEKKYFILNQEKLSSSDCVLIFKTAHFEE